MTVPVLPQEIAGQRDRVGQYESHMHFTMPGLYRVVSVRVCWAHPKSELLCDPHLFAGRF